jgi:23S rRNA (guanosine2251-2'-O)-methyltransferase
MKLGAKELRASEPTGEQLTSIRRREIYIVCDNVLDTYNIGSIFRLADAVAAKCVYLCGQSEIPPNSRIAKASVGTDKWVEWQYYASASEAISNIKNQISNIKIVAVEQSKKSVDFRRVDYREPIAFIVGNETEGVSKEALKMADQIVEIPMFGVNRSLNAMVSLAIVLYQAI